MSRTKDIEARLEALKGAVWFRGGEGKIVFFGSDVREFRINAPPQIVARCDSLATTEFVANAPEDVRHLLSVLEVLEHALEAVSEDRDVIRAQLEAGEHGPRPSAADIALKRHAARAERASNGTPVHAYLSTACQHERHEECRGVCKFCPAVCGCPCHREPRAESS